MHEEIKQTLIEFLAIIGFSFLLALALIAIIYGINLIVGIRKDSELDKLVALAREEDKCAKCGGHQSHRLPVWCSVCDGEKKDNE